MDTKIARFSVLCVSPDRSFVDDVKLLLDGSGMGPILSVTDFDDVLGAMAEGVINAILIQDAFPQLDAVELCRKIRTSSESPNARVPIVLICTDLSLQRTVEVSNAGANEVLLYPFHKSKLVHRLSAAFHDRRPFVEHEGYVGPDRRTRRINNHCGVTRRVDDPQTQDQPVAERAETTENSSAQKVIEPAAEGSFVEPYERSRMEQERQSS